jgi:hypothetical protein
MTLRHTNLQAAHSTLDQSSTSPCGSHYGGFAARTHNIMFAPGGGELFSIVFISL